MINSVILLSVLIFSILFWIWNLRKCPPGPSKLPLIGSVPFISLKNGPINTLNASEEVTEADVIDYYDSCLYFNDVGKGVQVYIFIEIK